MEKNTKTWIASKCIFLEIKSPSNAFLLDGKEFTTEKFIFMPRRHRKADDFVDLIILPSFLFTFTVIRSIFALSDEQNANNKEVFSTSTTF